MSHITGTVQTLTTPLTVGPDSGAAPSPPNTWTVNFEPPQAPGGTKLLVLHFENVKLPAQNRLEVELGYGTDKFTSADGGDFWTRPINVYAFPGGVPIHYITDGSNKGSVQLDRYGRGERHAGEPGHPSYSNCDPFLKDAVYTEPTYDPFWYCADPPDWENVACVPSTADIRAKVARSVGMILTVETSDYTGALELSTCSVTLVDADKVVTAGHCHTTDEALTSSVTFDYQVECDGSKPPGYNARWYKVKSVLGHRWDGTIKTGHDFSLLQLAEAVPGIPAIQMRHDVPGAGEQVFGVHHPNGAVKKLSIPHPDFDTVQESGPQWIYVPSDFHVSGGTSGSGLFDTAGRVVGVLSFGDPCHGGPPLKYFPTAAILQDLAPAPPPPVSRDVMVVVDRSGSMSEDDGTGRSKIEAARDAVSLFVQLVRAGAGNRLGLVSFSTTASSPVDFEIADVTTTNKKTLIGDPPYSGGKVGAVTPGGMTSIGAGLDAARLQMPTPGANPRAILLLTDGMQNTPPLVADVEGLLGGIDVHAIGFGSDANLDGALLTNLTAAHGGLYTRAESGLALEKFFSHAFGNIFESGVLFDPEYELAANQDGKPHSFHVCGDEAITIVAGWDRSDAELLLEVTTPGGAGILASSPGIEDATGRTWTFLRIPLPHGGERDGVWSARVLRPGGGGEFPPPAPQLHYFLNAIPTGGARLRRLSEATRYYTGDPINPLVQLRYTEGSWPRGAEVHVTVSRPTTGVGNILTEHKLGKPEIVKDDTLPARQATLAALERESGQRLVKHATETFDLRDDAASTHGAFEASGVFGKQFDNLLAVEGDYTFHFRATYGAKCTASRELLWSLHADVGVDATQTEVTTTVTGTRPDGRHVGTVTIIPRDRYGNHLGPGRGDSLTVTGGTGTTVTGGVRDNDDGSYTLPVAWDPAGDPGLVIQQPGRPPVAVTPIPGRPKPKEAAFVYSVKFVCGAQSDDPCGCAPVQPGSYATEINIHNFHDRPLKIEKRLLPLVLAAAPVGREPRCAERRAAETVELPPHAATMDDCCRLAELLLGASPSGPLSLTIGLLEIVSPIELAVSAVYTVTPPEGGASGIDVKTIYPQRKK